MSRVFKEWRQINKLSPSQLQQKGIVSLAPLSEEDISNWRAVIQGPAGTPYKHHQFELDIEVPPEYPSQPPAVKFKPCKMPHPNVKWESGEICLDILTAESWTPIFSILYCVEAIVRLLQQPNGDSPMNLELGTLVRIGDAAAYESLIKYHLFNQ